MNTLVSCLTGEFVPDTVAAVPVTGLNGSNSSHKHDPQSRPSHQAPSDRLRHPARNGSRDLEITKGPAQPVSQLPHAPVNQKLFNAPASKEAYRDRTPLADTRDAVHRREPSASQSSIASGQEDSLPPPAQPPHRGPFKRPAHGSDLPSSTSLPAHLDQISGSTSHTSLPSSSTSHSRLANTLNASDADLDAANGRQPGSSRRPNSPEKKIKISAPSNGVPIGADFKRKEDRRNKVKSSFWGFADRRAHGKCNGTLMYGTRV